MESKNYKELNLIIIFKQTILKVKESYKQQTYWAHLLRRKRRRRGRKDGGNDEGMYNQKVPFEGFFSLPVMVGGLVHLKEHDHNEPEYDNSKGFTKV
jgi:hypothetical protein